MTKPSIPRQPFSIDVLKEKLTPILNQFEPVIDTALDYLVVTIKSPVFIDFMSTIRHHSELAFPYLSTISANDHYPKTPRFNVDYFVFGLETHSFYMLVKVWLEDTEAIPSVCHLWRNADWHERETYDMFGINFLNHPYTLDGHPRRILLPDNWDGFPLRKEYPHDGLSVWRLGSNVLTPSFEDPESVADFTVELPQKPEAEQR